MILQNKDRIAILISFFLIIIVILIWSISHLSSTQPESLDNEIFEISWSDEDDDDEDDDDEDDDEDDDDEDDDDEDDDDEDDDDEDDDDEDDDDEDDDDEDENNDGDDDNESDKESKKQSSTSFNNPMIRFLLYLLIFIIAINYTSYSKEELSSMEEE